MIKLLSSIIGFFIGIKTVFAASIWDTDSVISPPVGQSVLPGGGLQAENI